MRRTRGFRLRSKLVKIFKWRRTLGCCHHQQPELPPRSSNPFSKLFAMARRSLEGRAKTLSFSSRVGYVQMGGDADRVGSKPAVAPKGYLTVYVGGSEDETQRYLVPVIYFNHPMFGKLLEAAEKIYGFDHPGRITIPCKVSEFEEVKRSIAASENFHRRRGSGGHRRWHW